MPSVPFSNNSRMLACPALTVNGKADAVLVDARECEKISSAFSLLRNLIPAEQDVAKGKYKEARAFFKDFRRDRERYGSIAFSLPRATHS